MQGPWKKLNVKRTDLGDLFMMTVFPCEARVHSNNIYVSHQAKV